MKRAVLLGTIAALAVAVAVTAAGGRGILFQAIFTMGGTGAADRTAQSKLADFINVKDKGALCDGSTDDTTAFTNALALAREVRVPGNVTCKITSLTIPTATALVGDGSQTSVLTSSAPTGCVLSMDSVDGVTIRGLTINALGTSATKRAVCLLNTTASTRRNTLRDLLVQADPANPQIAGTYGIYLNATTSNSLYWTEIDHIQTNFWDTGIRLEGSTSPVNGPNSTFLSAISTTASITGVSFLKNSNDNSIHGIHCQASGYASAQTCVVIGDGTNNSGGNHVYGLVSDQGANGTPLAISLAATNNTVWLTNESTLTYTNGNEPSTDTNTVCMQRPGSTSTCTIGNLALSNGSLAVPAANSGAGGAMAIAAGAGAANLAGGNLTIKSGAGGAGTASPGDILLSPGARAGSTNGGNIVLGQLSAQGVSGVRIRSSRVTIASKGIAPADCAGAALNPTVSTLLDGSIFTCATAQTLTMPTAQGSGGIVQNLPTMTGAVTAVGDLFEFVMSSTAAANFTLAAGTGGTIIGNAVINNAQKIWRCRVTVVTAGSETISCY